MLFPWPRTCWLVRNGALSFGSKKAGQRLTGQCLKIADPRWMSLLSWVLQEASEFQQFVGIARWAVELGRLNIACEVSVLSSYLALPRQGHCEALMNVFISLEKEPGRFLEA